MLKITTGFDGVSSTIELEGSLAGPWVEELEKCWREISPDRSLRVLLAAVTFIDEAGKDLLGRIHASGGVLQASGCLTKCIVQEITRGIREK